MKKQEDGLLTNGESLIEPELWFHDIVRKDGTPFDKEEISFIKDILKNDPLFTMSYKVVTNYYLSPCNPYRQRACFNTNVEW